MPRKNIAKPWRHVELVSAIAEHGSISAAATVLGTSQSALTKGLQRAEAEFGRTLFDRHPRGVLPTAFGRVLVEHARLILRQSQDALVALEALAQEHGGVVVGAGASFLDTLLPRTIARLVVKRPTIRVALRIDTVPTLLQWLRDGRIDLAFVSEVPGIAAEQDLSWMPVIADEMDIVGRLGHPLTERDRVTIAELKACGWVLGGTSDPQQRRLATVFRAHGIVPPEPTVETLSRIVAVQIVRQSDLLTLLPNARSHPQAAGLARVPCQEAAWNRVAGISFRKGAPLPPAGAALIEELTATCRELDDASGP